MSEDSALGANHFGQGAEGFPYRVLLGPPTTRTIPTFALQAGSGGLDRELWSASKKDDINTIDKQALGKPKSGKFGDHRFLTIRHKRDARTSCYATWLAFSDEGCATAF